MTCEHLWHNYNPVGSSYTTKFGRPSSEILHLVNIASSPLQVRGSIWGAPSKEECDRNVFSWYASSTEIMHRPGNQKFVGKLLYLILKKLTLGNIPLWCFNKEKRTLVGLQLWDFCAAGFTLSVISLCPSVFWNAAHSTDNTQQHQRVPLRQHNSVRNGSSCASQLTCTYLCSAVYWHHSLYNRYQSKVLISFFHCFTNFYCVEQNWRHHQV